MLKRGFGGPYSLNFRQKSFATPSSSSSNPRPLNTLSTSRPALRAASIKSLFTFDTVSGVGTSQSGSKKRGSSGPASRPNFSLKLSSSNMLENVCVVRWYFLWWRVDGYCPLGISITFGFHLIIKEGSTRRNGKRECALAWSSCLL